jgi:hypothetical protein
MRTKRSNSKSYAAVLANAAVVAVVIAGSASPVLAQARGLEGVWGVVTQERNCTTNAALGPPTRALVTYHTGGTLSENRSIPVFATGQLSDTHGIWSHDGGATFSTRTVTMVQFETAPGTPAGSPGFQAGWLMNAQTITMSGPDNFTSTGSGQFFNLNREVYRVGCASRVGERLR